MCAANSERHLHWVCRTPHYEIPCGPNKANTVVTCAVPAIIFGEESRKNVVDGTQVELVGDPTIDGVWGEKCRTNKESEYPGWGTRIHS